MRNKLIKSLTLLVLAIAMVIGMITPWNNRAQAKPKKCRVEFKDGGITGVSNLPSGFSVDENKPFTIPSTKPTRKYYDFLGYATSPTSKTVVYKAGQKNVKISSDVTLYPVWGGGPGTYKITYYTHGGSVIVNGLAVEDDPYTEYIGAGCYTSLKSCFDLGYGNTFKGYSTSMYGNVTYYGGQTIRVTKNLVLYAKYYIHEFDFAGNEIVYEWPCK